MNHDPSIDVKLILAFDARIQQVANQLESRLEAIGDKCDALEAGVRGMAEGLAVRPYRIASSYPIAWLARLIFQLIGMWVTFEWVVNFAARIFGRY